MQTIIALRRPRFTGEEIDEALGISLSTASGTLAREGLGRLGRLGLEQPSRSERQRPGELGRIAIERLGRSRAGPASAPSRGPEAPQPDPYRIEGKRRHYVGYECVHVRVDDYTQLTYAEVLPDEKQQTAIGFLRRAVAFYRPHEIRAERLLTDSGSAYLSAEHARACAASASGTSAPAPPARRRTARTSAHPHALRLGLEDHGPPFMAHAFVSTGLRAGCRCRCRRLPSTCGRGLAETATRPSETAIEPWPPAGQATCPSTSATSARFSGAWRHFASLPKEVDEPLFVRTSKSPGDVAVVPGVLTADRHDGVTIALAILADDNVHVPRA